MKTDFIYIELLRLPLMDWFMLSEQFLLQLTEDGLYLRFKLTTQSCVHSESGLQNTGSTHVCCCE